MTARQWIMAGAASVIALVCIGGAFVTWSAPLIVVTNAALAEPPDKPQAKPPLIAFDPVPIDAFNAVFDRPVFNPDRAPFAGGAPEPGADNDPAERSSGGGQSRLVGIVISNNTRIALFEGATGARPVRVKQGGRHQGWTVQKILSDQVVLERGGKTSVRKLSYHGRSAVLTD